MATGALKDRDVAALREMLAHELPGKLAGVQIVGPDERAHDHERG